MKYSNIEIPEIRIEDIDPVIHFSTVQCPNCKVILDCEKDIKVKSMSTGRDWGRIQTTATANCTCSYCKTKFDAETIVSSKFSAGLFTHLICCIMLFIGLLGIAITFACALVCKIKKESVAGDYFLILFLISLAITIISAATGSVLESSNDDCILYIGKKFNE